MEAVAGAVVDTVGPCLRPLVPRAVLGAPLAPRKTPAKLVLASSIKLVHFFGQKILAHLYCNH